MTTTAINEIQANIARLAAQRGMTLEQLADKSHEPLSAVTGTRLYLRSVERAARTLGVTINAALGFGECEPWCTNHQDDGETDYCCHRVGEYDGGLPIEIWHDQEATRINIERSIDNDAFTPTQAQQVADAMAEAVRILDGHEAS